MTQNECETECKQHTCANGHDAHGGIQQFPDVPVTRMIGRTTQRVPPWKRPGQTQETNGEIVKGTTTHEAPVEEDWVKLGAIDVARQLDSKQQQPLQHDTTESKRQPQQQADWIDSDGQCHITPNETCIHCTTTHYITPRNP